MMAVLMALAMAGAATFPGMAQAQGAGNPAASTAPVKRIDIYVTPYFEAAATADGHPRVSVGMAFDAQLASNDRADIVAVRDAIQAAPQRITPMTLMVLSIRLYDVGLRDDAVFWYYVAKNRFFAMAGVLNMNAPSLTQARDAVNAFGTLAGPFINSYAFCNFDKQRSANAASLDWVEAHPYEPVFMTQLPALPGDRATNLKQTLDKLRSDAAQEAVYLSNPKNRADFLRKRDERHVTAQYCWAD